MKQPFNPLVFRGVELGVILPPRRHLEGRRDDFFFFFFFWSHPGTEDRVYWHLQDSGQRYC